MCSMKTGRTILTECHSRKEFVRIPAVPVVLDKGIDSLVLLLACLLDSLSVSLSLSERLSDPPHAKVASAVRPKTSFLVS